MVLVLGEGEMLCYSCAHQHTTDQTCWICGQYTRSSQDASGFCGAIGQQARCSKGPEGVVLQYTARACFFRHQVGQGTEKSNPRKHLETALSRQDRGTWRVTSLFLRAATWRAHLCSVVHLRLEVEVSGKGRKEILRREAALC